MTQSFITKQEIFEGPTAVAKTLENKEKFEGIANGLPPQRIRAFHFVGAGTSLHAGIAGSYAIRGLAGRPAFVAYATEFPYDYAKTLGKEDVVVAISQSGETTDTVNAANLAKKQKVKVLAITNDASSSLARLGDYVLETKATKENSVMATKTYCAQLAAVFGLAVSLSAATIEADKAKDLWNELKSISAAMKKTLETNEGRAVEAAKELKFIRDVFVMSAGPNVATAREAALKLKEGSAVHSEAYSAAEFRHGPVTLIGPSVGVAAVVPYRGCPTRDPVLAIAKDAKEKGGTVLAACEDGDEVERVADHSFLLPRTNEYVWPLVAVLPFQLLAYHLAIRKGLNPDSPKGLVKVVKL